jgi:hypothetical protein
MQVIWPGIKVLTTHRRTSMNSPGHLGISGFQPQWLSGFRKIHAAHAERLAGLPGRRLTASAVVRFSEDDDWYADCPVILAFENEQIEVSHQKFDDLSITWNTINTGEPIAGWDESELTPLWRFDDDRLTPLHDQVLQEIALLEYVGQDMANGMVAVEFAFPSGLIRIANALDENVIETSVAGPEFRRVVIGQV